MDMVTVKDTDTENMGSSLTSKSKELIKKLVPQNLLRHYQSRKVYLSYLSDARRFIESSNTIKKNDRQEKLRADIIQRYHAVEKGLTMPARRYLFGRELILTLIERCRQYSRDYGTEDLQVRQAVMILNEYLEIHALAKVEIDSELKGMLEDLAHNYHIDVSTKQISAKYDGFFSNSAAEFPAFAFSRVSIRNYAEKEIPPELIDDAVRIALSAPSACNRQPSRVFMVSDKEKMRKVLALQNGNRGFGHLADKLLIVTVDLSGFHEAAERNLGWVDGGIFSMNLLYGLHYNGIGACPLNWAVMPDADLALHKICGIPDWYRVVLMISCGYPNEQFDHPISLRYKSVDCLKHI